MTKKNRQQKPKDTARPSSYISDRTCTMFVSVNRVPLFSMTIGYAELDRIRDRTQAALEVIQRDLLKIHTPEFTKHHVVKRLRGSWYTQLTLRFLLERFHDRLGPHQLWGKDARVRENVQELIARVLFDGAWWRKEENGRSMGLDPITDLEHDVNVDIWLNSHGEVGWVQVLQARPLTEEEAERTDDRLEKAVNSDPRCIGAIN